MLMTAEDVMRTYLDQMHPRKVPYVGSPLDDGLTDSARNERRRRRTEYLAQLAVENARKAQTDANNPDVPTILAAVAAAHGIVVASLLSRRRDTRASRARHHAIWELKQRKPTIHSPQVGEILGRDSSTVRDGLARFEKDRHTYEGAIQVVACLLAGSRVKG